MATGDLNDSIQQSLKLVVGADAKLNEETSARRLLDPKFPENIMEKLNRIDFVTQNLIIENLLSQIPSQKLTDEKVNIYLGKLPSLKDIEIHKRHKKLKSSGSEYTPRNILLSSPPLSLPPPTLHLHLFPRSTI